MPAPRDVSKSNAQEHTAEELRIDDLPPAEQTEERDDALRGGMAGTTTSTNLLLDNPTWPARD